MKPLPGIRRSIIPPPRWGADRVLIAVAAALFLVVLLAEVAR